MPEKILVVDDDLDSLKLIGLMLQRKGYEVIAANTGAQALAKAAAERPNLVILDVMMPDLSGYEVCRRMRATPETQGIPIIMFTAKTMIDDKVAGFEAGADDYLTKPTHPEELASRVRAILVRNAVQHRPEGNKGTTIGFLGAKGGVGTTTLALNTGAALMLAGENPVVADFRLGAGSMGLSIGFGRSQGMANVLGKAVADIRPRLIEGELAVHQSGLRTLLSSVRSKEAMTNYPLENMIAIVRMLRTMAQPAIFDLGAGMNPGVVRLLQEMDETVIVVEPTSVALIMARELLQEFEAIQVQTERVHVVVVTRAQSSVQTPWQEIERLLGREIRAIISAAPELMFQAVQAGVPAVMSQPNAVVSNQMVKMSEDLNARIRTLTSSEPKN